MWLAPGSSCLATRCESESQQPEGTHRAAPPSAQRWEGPEGLLLFAGRLHHHCNMAFLSELPSRHRGQSSPSGHHLQFTSLLEMAGFKTLPLGKGEEIFLRTSSPEHGDAQDSCPAIAAGNRHGRTHLSPPLGSLREQRAQGDCCWIWSTSAGAGQAVA